jgi:hypothetical protein
MSLGPHDLSNSLLKMLLMSHTYQGFIRVHYPYGQFFWGGGMLLDST